MKHMLKTPEVVVDPSTMHKVPIEKERVQENKGAATPKKVISCSYQRAYCFLLLKWDRFLKVIRFQAISSFTGPAMATRLLYYYIMLYTLL